MPIVRPARIWSLVIPTVATVAVSIAVLTAGSDRSPTPRPPTLRPPTLGPVVRATLAAGSARVTGTLIPPGQPALDLEGVTSFTDGRSRFLAGRLDRGESAAAEVRTTPAGLWLRPPRAAHWLSLGTGAGSASGAGGLTGWADVLDRLAEARVIGGAEGRRRRVIFQGEVATVDIDAAGRIRRLRMASGDDVLDVTFSAFGIDVEVEAPPGTAP